jgi:chromosome segregation ATPase
MQQESEDKDQKLEATENNLKNAENEIKDMKQELEETKQKFKDMEQKHKETKGELEHVKNDRQSKITELKRVRVICDQISTQDTTQHRAVTKPRGDLQPVDASVGDTVDSVQALTQLCRDKDEKLKEKDEAIARIQELADAARHLNDTNGAWSERVKKREQKTKQELKKAVSGSSFKWNVG